jgi:hypothetical protein
MLSRCGYGTTSTGYDIFKKVLYVYGHKLKYGYVSGTDTGTYPVPVLYLKWNIRASQLLYLLLITVIYLFYGGIVKTLTQPPPSTTTKHNICRVVFEVIMSQSIF